MPFQSPATPIQDLDTPALLLDLDAFQRNVERMARFFADQPTALRPHAKTHKCPQVALRQLQAGAIGITCAKVGEAEVMAEAGVGNILIANQVVGRPKIDRLTRLARHCDLIVAVDDPHNIQELAQACQARGVTLRVLVEVDVGMHRCGVQPGDAVLQLARQISRVSHLHFAGLLAYEGHLVMVPDPQARATRVRQAMLPLQETCDLLARAGLPAQIVSGGGTGTYDITGTCPPFTEVEAGSYVFMDATYRQVRPEFEVALTVLATVISRPAPDRIIVDAGIKSMTQEFGPPQPLDVAGATVRKLSEEHGILELVADPGSVQASPQRALRPGDQVRFIPSHCCTTVNLHDALHVIQGDVLVDVWPIAARGRAQ